MRPSGDQGCAGADIAGTGDHLESDPGGQLASGGAAAQRTHREPAHSGARPPPAAGASEHAAVRDGAAYPRRRRHIDAAERERDTQPRR